MYRDKWTNKEEQKALTQTYDFQTLDMPCSLALRSTLVSVIQMHLSLVPGGWCQPGGRPNVLLQKPSDYNFRPGD